MVARQLIDSGFRVMDFSGGTLNQLTLQEGGRITRTPLDLVREHSGPDLGPWAFLEWEDAGG